MNPVSVATRHSAMGKSGEASSGAGGQDQAGDQRGSGAQPVIKVALSDFPLFDGAASLDSFLSQCQRLAQLGGIAADHLPSIIAARCRGLAQQVVEGAAVGSDAEAVLRRAFSATPATAAAQLGSLKKGNMSVIEYSLEVKKLIRSACPEFFDNTGKVKSVCGVSYQAALYRHLLVGLNDQDKILISRQGAATFEAAVDELLREEALQSGAGADVERPGVHWAECVAVEAGERRLPDRSPSPRDRREASPEGRSGRRWMSPGRGGRPRGRSSGGGWRNRGGGPRGGSPGGGGRAGTPSPPPGPGRSATRAFSAGGRESSSEDEQRQRRRPPQCYACRGFGHLKRDCPNVRRGGRW